MIFENCILKNYFLTPLPTYATNWNGLNNFGRGTPWDHFCEVWSKFNEGFQSRSRLNEKVYAHTDERRTKDCHNSSLSTLCSGEQKRRWPTADIMNRESSLCAQVRQKSGNSYTL